LGPPGSAVMLDMIRSHHAAGDTVLISMHDGTRVSQVQYSSHNLMMKSTAPMITVTGTMYGLDDAPLENKALTYSVCIVRLQHFEDSGSPVEIKQRVEPHVLGSTQYMGSMYAENMGRTKGLGAATASTMTSSEGNQRQSIVELCTATRRIVEVSLAACRTELLDCTQELQALSINVQVRCLCP
jgi:hypothetical protein